MFFVDKDIISSKSIARMCSKPDKLALRTYDDHFSFIDSKGMISIAICQDEKSVMLFEKLKRTGVINLRDIQLYTCTVYQHEFDELIKQGVVDDFGSGVYFLTNNDYYDSQTGLAVEGHDIYI